MSSPVFQPWWCSILRCESWALQPRVEVVRNWIGRQYTTELVVESRARHGNPSSILGIVRLRASNPVLLIFSTIWVNLSTSIFERWHSAARSVAVFVNMIMARQTSLPTEPPDNYYHLDVTSTESLAEAWSLRPQKHRHRMQLPLSNSAQCFILCGSSKSGAILPSHIVCFFDLRSDPLENYCGVIPKMALFLPFLALIKLYSRSYALSFYKTTRSC